MVQLYLVPSPRRRRRLQQRLHRNLLSSVGRHPQAPAVCSGRLGRSEACRMV
jgi:hypothetical protein